MVDRDAYRNQVRADAMEHRLKFDQQYRQEVQGLMGLTADELLNITPETTKLIALEELITVVKDATSSNLAQAELKNRILRLGETAVSIAKKVPKLAKLFI